MMQRLRFTGTFKLALLTEELSAAFPSWTIPDRVHGTKYLGMVRETENGIIVIFPDTTPDASVQAIVAAHNPNALSQNEKDQQDYQQSVANVRNKLSVLGLSPDETDVLL